ncbi:MAG: zinc-binding alcohol dehydrogenase [Oscillospiraceae bacterium]|nr:zinc-binding alcohol dehydrogenase [Oscillospiraceae bacterium]
MDNQVIVFTAPNTAELITCDMPRVEPGHVLVRTVISSISSGTERALLTGDANISPNPNSVGAPVQFPRWPGYSSAGIVMEVGEGVTSVAPGDRVAVIDQRHQHYVCPPEKNVFKLPDYISFSEAALWHIATFPLAAIRKCKLEIGESAIVMGLGVLGMMAVKLLRAAGATPIIAVDPVADKRQWAIENGADFALDPFDPEFSAKAKALTNGGAAVGIEVTGIGKGLDGILDCMAKFGRVALLGCTRNSDFTIDYYRKVHGPGITLVGAHTNARPKIETYPGMWTRQDDTRALLQLCASGRVEFASMVAEIHPAEEAPSTYARLGKERFFPVVQHNWGE